ncbi:vWA domain-containing protein [Schaalia cardiffensis]
MTITLPKHYSASPLLPVYLICDTSASMASSSVGGTPPIKVLNESINSLMNEIVRRGNRDIDVHLCIISFSNSAEVVRPLSRVVPDSIFETPLKAHGSTNFEAGLQLFKTTLSKDENERRNNNWFRPLCFFLTDGVPTDKRGVPLAKHSSWASIAAELRSRPVAPRIVPCALDMPMPDIFEILRNPLGADLTHFEEVPHNGVKDVGRRIAQVFSGVAKTIFLATDNTIGDTVVTEILSPGMSDDDWAQAGRTSVLNPNHDDTTNLLPKHDSWTNHFHSMEESMTHALTMAGHSFDDIGDGFIIRR